MQESIFFKNRKGESLSGIISVPERSTKKLPIIIMCHGMRSSKNAPLIEKIAEHLIRINYAVFRFDFSGHGESEGDFDDITISKAIGELESAYEHIKKYDNIDCNDVSLYGRSFGGNIALCFASNNENIKSIFLNAPLSDFPDIIHSKCCKELIRKWKNGKLQNLDELPLLVEYKFYEDSLHHEIIKIASNINLRTFIVHGDLDDTVPFGQSVKLKDIIGNNAVLKIFKGGDHGLRNQDEPEKICALAVDFFKKNRDGL